REAATQIGEPEGLVHFGVAAAGHVKRELGRRLFEYVNFERAVFAPAVEGLGESLERFITEELRQLTAPLSSQFADQTANDFERALFTYLGSERPYERPHDTCLDFALLDQRQCRSSAFHVMHP